MQAARAASRWDLGAAPNRPGRERHYTSSLDDVEGRYFNPPRYTEALAVVAMRRRWESGWSVLAEAGTGRRYVGDEPQRPARLASLGLVRQPTS